MEAFYRDMGDLLASIDDCASKGRLLPCLTLLYSGMDVMASLDALPNESNQASFVRWVERYLSINDCTPLDIYAARCGIVHTFAADSRLARDGRAKKIAYAWGTAKVDKLKRASVALGRQDWQCLHIGELVIAFKQAVIDHWNHIQSDALAMERFKKAAGIWFTDLDGEKVDDFLAVIG
jgi:hypothetical protein